MLKKMLLAAVFISLPLTAFATPEYDACYEKAKDDDEVALCMKAETARLMKDIQEVYLNVSKNKQTADWNNGNGLLSGNLKNMYNNWIAYRDKYCSLFTKASEYTFGSESFDRERCLLNLTLDHLELMQNVILNANSGGEEDDIEDE